MDGAAILIVDACVLIDLLEVDPAVIAAIVVAIGPINVASVVLDEVDGLTRERAGELGLSVVDPAIELMIGAAERRGRLSFADRVCLLVAVQNGWTSVTNDGALRRACADEGVAVLWGLEAIAISVERGHLNVSLAFEASEAIARKNPFVTAAVVAAFRERLERSVG